MTTDVRKGGAWRHGCDVQQSVVAALARNKGGHSEGEPASEAVGWRGGYGIAKVALVKAPAWPATRYCCGRLWPRRGHQRRVVGLDEVEEVTMSLVAVLLGGRSVAVCRGGVVVGCNPTVAGAAARAREEEKEGSRGAWRLLRERKRERQWLRYL